MLLFWLLLFLNFYFLKNLLDVCLWMLFFFFRQISMFKNCVCSSCKRKADFIAVTIKYFWEIKKCFLNLKGENFAFGFFGIIFLRSILLSQFLFLKSSFCILFNNLENQVQMTSPNNTNSPMFRFSSPIVKSTEADVLPPPSVSSNQRVFHFNWFQRHTVFLSSPRCHRW